MQGIWACRNEPLLDAVPRIHLLAVASSSSSSNGRWNSLPVPFTMLLLLVVLLVVMTMMMMTTMPLLTLVISGGRRRRRRRGGVEALDGEKHFPWERQRMIITPPLAADEASVEREGERGEPEEEEESRGGSSRASHGHRGGSRTRGVMDDGASQIAS